MGSTFQYAAVNATEFDIGNLDNWNTSKVTTMYGAFAQSGMSASTWNIGDISGWDTSSVTDMRDMFSTAGRKVDWSLDLSSWNVDSVTQYKGFNYNSESKIVLPNFK